jgi:hypothetical protein
MSPEGVLTTLAHLDGFNGAKPRGAVAEREDGSFWGHDAKWGTPTIRVSFFG